MNKHLQILLILISGAFSSAMGQGSPSGISDEELKQYALVMDSINQLTENLKVTLTRLIKNNPKLAEARYNQLIQIGDDKAKLQQANATADELAALQDINLKRTEETIKLSEAIKSLTNEKIGPATYSRLRQAVKSDPEVKARYEKIVAGLPRKP